MNLVDKYVESIEKLNETDFGNLEQLKDVEVPLDLINEIEESVKEEIKNDVEESLKKLKEKKIVLVQTLI